MNALEETVNYWKSRTFSEGLVCDLTKYGINSGVFVGFSTTGHALLTTLEFFSSDKREHFLFFEASLNTGVTYGSSRLIPLTLPNDRFTMIIGVDFGSKLIYSECPNAAP